MSQERLAEACGVSFQQVQKYESGANRISFSRLLQIARALNCRLSDLVGALDAPNNPSSEGPTAFDILAHSTARVQELVLTIERLPPPSRAALMTFLKSLTAPSPADFDFTGFDKRGCQTPALEDGCD
jgi:transcriptional regulator with XRE-family HTH domain